MTQDVPVSGEHGHPPGEKAHASVGTYVRVAVILSVITALEFGVIYIRRLTPILLPLLLVMSAAKFALVAMFFMHLRYDGRALGSLFVGPLIVATGLAVALVTLSGAFLVFGR
jgi:cytochrome c oxidase subunit 4